MNRRGLPYQFKQTDLAAQESVASRQGPLLAVLFNDRKKIVILSTCGSARQVPAPDFLS